MLKHVSSIKCGESGNGKTLFSISSIQGITIINIQNKSIEIDAPKQPDEPAKTILVVEDEEILRDLLRKSLNRSGYDVLSAENGRYALDTLQTNQVDLILLDIMMPQMDGFEFCEEIRQTSDVPIIILTALNRPDDVVRGLQLGADEYITKPFSFSELSVRIESMLRRISWTKGVSTFSLTATEGVSLDDETGRVTLNEREVQLTPMEFKFLRYLMLRPDQPISNEVLLREVWNYEENANASIIQSIVRRLRMKIEESPSNPQFVVSVWGIGYKFQSQAEAVPEE